MSIKTNFTVLAFLCLSSVVTLKPVTYTSYSIGMFDYTNGSDGYSATGHFIGNRYHASDNQGNHSVTYSIGNRTYTDIN